MCVASLLSGDLGHGHRIPFSESVPESGGVRGSVPQMVSGDTPGTLSGALLGHSGARSPLSPGDTP